MTIAFIGLGEAAVAFISGWGQARAFQITAFDIKSENPDTEAEISERAASLGIRACATLAEALVQADLVFSTVTADQAVVAASAAARYLNQGAVFCDLNSCAPSSKLVCEGVIAEAGGSYLDVAVMAPVHPGQNMVPCLVSGTDAERLAGILDELPMAVRVVDGPVGRASSIKMVRSVMVKGMEALTAECTLAAIAAGVVDQVFPSMVAASPNLDMAERAGYNFERSLRHGERRAAEMDEVAKTLTDLGLPNDMSRATAEWQRRIARSGAPVPDTADYRIIADALLPLIRKKP